jgi:hypothetical protein
MQDILALHCGIENCNIHCEYKYDKDKVVAIAAHWKNKKSKAGISGGLLSESPKNGQRYQLQIKDALKIDLAERFWVVYFEPYTTSEGIESEIGIASMLFCLCEKKNIINIERRQAIIEVMVIESKKITADNNIKADINIKTNFLNRKINPQYVSILHFERFSMIEASYQGDCGWTYIIEKKDGSSRIIAEHNWGFHENLWQLINEELTAEEEKIYGIQHIIDKKTI